MSGGCVGIIAGRGSDILKTQAESFMPVDNSVFTNFQPTITQVPLGFSLSAAELASLMSSRLCHDLISPIGAINNVMELFEEGLGDDETMKLIQMSAANASARLQFARLAFGSAGSAGDTVGLNAAEKLARDYLGGGKVTLTWETELHHLPKEAVKLLLNLVILANAAIPRGGELNVIIAEKRARPHFYLSAEGTICRLPQAFTALYQGAMAKHEISAHNIQFYWTLLLCAETGMPLDIAEMNGKLYFAAK